MKTLVKELKQYDGRLGAYKAVCVAVRYGQQWCVALQHISSMCVCAGIFADAHARGVCGVHALAMFEQSATSKHQAL